MSQKQEVQRNILIDGGSDLVNLLMQHDLIDEYRLLVHPVVVGRESVSSEKAARSRNSDS